MKKSPRKGDTRAQLIVRKFKSSRHHVRSAWAYPGNVLALLTLIGTTAGWIWAEMRREEAQTSEQDAQAELGFTKWLLEVRTVEDRWVKRVAGTCRSYVRLHEILHGAGGLPVLEALRPSAAMLDSSYPTRAAFRKQQEQELARLRDEVRGLVEACKALIWLRWGTLKATDATRTLHDVLDDFNWSPRQAFGPRLEDVLSETVEKVLDEAIAEELEDFRASSLEWEPGLPISSLKPLQ